MTCVFCRRTFSHEGVATKFGPACDDFCATKKLCVFCSKVILHGADILEGLKDHVRIDGVATNYGRACSAFCAAGGFVVEAMKCEAKETPCIGHDTRLCAGVNDLKAGMKESDNIDALKRALNVHKGNCTTPACTMPHTLAAVYARKSECLQGPAARPPKRQLTADDFGHVLRAFRAKYVPLSHQKGFTENMKGVMRAEGYREMEGVLDSYPRDPDLETLLDSFKGSYAEV